MIDGKEHLDIIKRSHTLHNKNDSKTYYERDQE